MFASCLSACLVSKSNTAASTTFTGYEKSASVLVSVGSSLPLHPCKINSERGLKSYRCRESNCQSTALVKTSLPRVFFRKMKDFSVAQHSRRFLLTWKQIAWSATLARIVTGILSQQHYSMVFRLSFFSAGIGSAAYLWAVQLMHEVILYQIRVVHVLCEVFQCQALRFFHEYCISVEFVPCLRHRPPHSSQSDLE